jgi:hypothetical protein
MFGRKKKRLELSARLESSIFAGKEGAEAMDALRQIALEDHSGPSPSVPEQVNRPVEGATEIDHSPGDHARTDSHQILVSIESRDLVESLPDVDINELAANSRLVAESLRRHNQSSQ